MEPERDLRLSLPLRGAPWGPSWALELVPGQALRLSTFGGEGGGGLGGVVPWVREGGWAEWRPQPGALPALTRGLGRTWPAAACPWRGRSWGLLAAVLRGCVPTSCSGSSWAQGCLCGFTISAYARAKFSGTRGGRGGHL